MDKKEFMRLNKIIFDYIYKINDDEIKELLSGNKKVCLIDKKNEKLKLDDSINDEIIQISKTLRKFTTRSMAIDYLIKNKYTVKVLKILAKYNNIYVNSRCKKNEIIDELVEGTVGVRLKFDALDGQ